MQGYEVYFNEVPLHNYVLITGVKRTVLPPRKNHSVKIPSMFGEHYTGYEYGIREVVLTCFLEATDQISRNEGLDFLADILNVGQPVKVVISDEPDKYFLAVPEDIEQERFTYNEEVHITLKCYDPYKYSIHDDYFKPNEKNIVNIVNSGSVEAYPVTSIEFLDKANFVQCTNYKGETILVGQRPNVDKPNSEGNSKVLADSCESMENWLPAGNVVEAGFEVMGTGQVNGGGYAIMCNDFGKSDKGWHGVALRRNIGANVNDFLVTLTLEHNSKGDVKGIGAGTNPPTPTPENPVKYQVQASPSLRIREGRGLNYRQIGSIPNNTILEVTEVANGWGKVSYNGINGYSSMEYMRKYTEPTATTYTIQAMGDVWVRSGAGTNFKQLTVAKKGTKVTTVSTEMSNGWYKVSVNGKTGYSSGKWWQKVDSGAYRTNATNAVETEPSAENRLGRIEVYGFGQNGERLFRCVLKDSEQWYEYTEPEVYIGSTRVLEDGKNTPSPNTIQVEDEHEKGKFVTKDTDSGKFGDWNEFYGNIYVKRETNSNGQQVWKTTVDKLVNGQVVKSMTTNSLIDASFPTVPLNHIVVYFAQYKDNPVVDVMGLTGVDVTNLVPYKPQENRPIFWAGDELRIDHTTNKVYLNNRLYMEDLDIGSQFFSVPTGESQFIFASDDPNIDVNIGLTKRYL